jgi:hypothetical protein
MAALTRRGRPRSGMYRWPASRRPSIPASTRLYVGSGTLDTAGITRIPVVSFVFTTPLRPFIIKNGRPERGGLRDNQKARSQESEDSSQEPPKTGYRRQPR